MPRATKRPEIFINYVSWAWVLFKRLNILPAIFLEKLELIQNECRREFEQPFTGRVDEAIQKAIERFPSMPDTVPSFIDEENEQGKMASRYLKAFLNSDWIGPER